MAKTWNNDPSSTAMESTMVATKSSKIQTFKKGFSSSNLPSSSFNNKQIIDDTGNGGGGSEKSTPKHSGTNQQQHRCSCSSNNSIIFNGTNRSSSKLFNSSHLSSSLPRMFPPADRSSSSSSSIAVIALKQATEMVTATTTSNTETGGITTKIGKFQNIPFGAIEPSLIGSLASYLHELRNFNPDKFIKEIELMLNYFEDAVKKEKLELLNGSVNVLIETVALNCSRLRDTYLQLQQIQLRLQILSNIHMDQDQSIQDQSSNGQQQASSSSSTSPIIEATNELNQNLSELVRWSDQVYLRQKNLKISDDNLLPNGKMEILRNGNIITRRVYVSFKNLVKAYQMMESDLRQCYDECLTLNSKFAELIMAENEEADEAQDRLHALYRRRSITPPPEFGAHHHHSHRNPGATGSTSTITSQSSLSSGSAVSSSSSNSSWITMNRLIPNFNRALKMAQHLEFRKFRSKLSSKDGSNTPTGSGTSQSVKHSNSNNNSTGNVEHQLWSMFSGDGTGTLKRSESASNISSMLSSTTSHGVSLVPLAPAATSGTKYDIIPRRPDLSRNNNNKTVKSQNSSPIKRSVDLEKPPPLPPKTYPSGVAGHRSIGSSARSSLASETSSNSSCSTMSSLGSRDAPVSLHQQRPASNQDTDSGLGTAPPSNSSGEFHRAEVLRCIDDDDGGENLTKAVTLRPKKKKPLPVVQNRTHRGSSVSSSSSSSSASSSPPPLPPPPESFLLPDDSSVTIPESNSFCCCCCCSSCSCCSSPSGTNHHHQHQQNSGSGGGIRTYRRRGSSNTAGATSTTTGGSSSNTPIDRRFVHAKSFDGVVAIPSSSSVIGIHSSSSPGECQCFSCSPPPPVVAGGDGGGCPVNNQPQHNHNNRRPSVVHSMMMMNNRMVDGSNKTDAEEEDHPPPLPPKRRNLHAYMGMVHANYSRPEAAITKTALRQAKSMFAPTMTTTYALSSPSTSSSSLSTNASGHSLTLVQDPYHHLPVAPEPPTDDDNEENHSIPPVLPPRRDREPVAPPPPPPPPPPPSFLMVRSNHHHHHHNHQGCCPKSSTPVQHHHHHHHHQCHRHRQQQKQQVAPDPSPIKHAVSPIRSPVKHDTVTESPGEPEPCQYCSEGTSHPEEECILARVDVPAELFAYRTGSDGEDNSFGPDQDILGGTIDALLIKATQASLTSDDETFVDCFLSTYRSFISAEDLLRKLMFRYRYFSRVTINGGTDIVRQSVAQKVVAFITQLINEIYIYDFDQQLLHTMMGFIYQLVTKGELFNAKFLREKCYEKLKIREKEFGNGTGRYLQHQISTDNCDGDNNNNSNSNSNSNSSLKDRNNSTGTLMVIHNISSKQSSLLDFKAEHIAEQMTLLDSRLFYKIETPEILIWAKEQKEEKIPNLSKFTGHFNNMSYWARSQILQCQEQKEREKFMMKFLKIMKNLRKLNNFNSYLAILSALDCAPISRLDWPKNITDLIRDYGTLIDSSSSFRIYRNILATSKPPCIPYIGLILQDLTFIHIGNNDFMPDGKVNWCKRSKQYNILSQMKDFKRCKYSINENETILNFFDNFEDHLPEDVMWQISDSLKPRHTTTNSSNSSGTPTSATPTTGISAH